VRITPIYEGTTGIQANDLVGRKTQYDGGQGVEELLTDMRATQAALESAGDEHSQYAAPVLGQHIEMIAGASRQILGEENPVLNAAVANDYLMMMGYATGCWAMARSVLAVNNHADEDFKTVKRAMCRFYFDSVAPKAVGHYQALENVNESHFVVASELL
jgi:hypothetical protein